MRILDLFSRKAKPNELSKNQIYEALYSSLYRAFGNVPLPKYINLKDTVDKAYLINEKIYAVINKILAGNTGVKFRVYEVKDTKKFRKYSSLQSKHYNIDQTLQLKSESLEEVLIPDVDSILAHPNNYQTADELEYDLGGFLLLTGNSYLYGGVRRLTSSSPSLQLYSLPAHLVSIIAGDWINPIKGYQIDSYGLTMIPVEDIGHLKYWNPDYSTPGSHLYGMPPLRAAWRLIQSDSEALNTQLHSFLNQGAQGFIHSGGENGWTVAQAQEAKDKWNAAKGSDSAGSLVFTSAPVGFTRIGLSPVDLGVMAIRGTTLRDICSVYNVPAQLINDPSSSTYNNIKEARKALITDACLPLKEKIKGLYNRFFIPRWNKELNKNLYIDFDLSDYTELTDDLDSLYNRANSSSFISINEKREMTGFERIENPILDEPFMPMGMIPLSEMDNNTMDDEAD